MQVRFPTRLALSGVLMLGVALPALAAQAARPSASPQQVRITGVVRDESNAITLPGYAVPLEGDGQTVTAFLLVPFFGACIHVPPPPSNQVVLVRAPSGVPVDDLWDAIKVSGTLHVQDSHHDLANAGYTLDAVTVTPYPN